MKQFCHLSIYMASSSSFLEQDASGICGGIFHYSLILAFMGSAMLAFVYFWSKGQLDMDESPKIQMMDDE